MKKLPKRLPMSHWLVRVQDLISANSTPPRTRGKYKGHGSTDALKWTTQLAKEIQADIRRCSRGIGYDENMALASALGAVLFSWYALVHRAKAYDPNRPLKLRKKALKRRDDVVNDLIRTVNSDGAMAFLFPGQQYDMPHSKFAKGGKFV